jgi:PAS domain S-box-containing protein
MGVPRFIGLAVTIAALLTLLGWVLDVAALRDWIGSGIAMKANAAVAAAAFGISLFLLSLSSPPLALVRVLGFLALMIGGLTLFEHATGINLGIDTLIWPEPAGMPATVAPGRIGPPASLSCFVLGAGLIGLTSRARWPRRFAVCIGILVSLLGLLSIGGYVFSADMLYGVALVTAISLQMACLVLAMGLGLIAAAPDRQPMKTLIADTGAGLLARRALPFIILLPFALAWLRTLGENAGFYDAGAGRAILVVTLVGLFCGLLAWAAAIIDSRERALMASEESFATAFAASPDALVITRADDGLIREANDSYLKLIGLRREEAIGRTSVALGIYRDTAARQKGLEELQDAGRLRDHEVDLVKPTGEVVNTICSAEPIEIGGQTYLLTIIRDVTEAKRTQMMLLENEQRLRSMNEELERRVAERTAELLEANEQLNGFTYSVAHDLRQSIRGIVMNAQMVENEYKDVLDDEGRSALERLANSGKKLSYLVDDLLRYARISKHEPRREGIDVTALVRMVAAECLERYPEADIRTQEGLHVVADPGLLKLVFENLVDNACKYVAPKAHARIDVGSEDGAFFVKDNGIGFEQQYAERIFEPFERLEVLSHYPGTGIGLANVKRAVEKHRGSVWAVSSPGKGTTIWFTLSSADEQAALDASDAEAASS